MIQRKHSQKDVSSAKGGKATEKRTLQVQLQFMEKKLNIWNVFCSFSSFGTSFNVCLGRQNSWWSDILLTELCRLIKAKSRELMQNQGAFSKCHFYHNLDTSDVCFWQRVPTLNNIWMLRFYRKLQKEIKADYSRNKKDIKAGVPPTFEEYWRYLLQNLPFNRSTNVSDIWSTFSVHKRSFSFQISDRLDRGLGGARRLEKGWLCSGD